MKFSTLLLSSASAAMLDITPAKATTAGRLRRPLRRTSRASAAPSRPERSARRLAKARARLN